MSEKSFKNIIKITAAIVIISVAVCVFMFLLPDKNNKTVFSSGDSGEIISYVEPSQDNLYNSSEEVTLSVCAKSGSTGYAMISGQKIPLNLSSVPSEGAVILSSTVSLPQSTGSIQNLGSVAFFVTYNSITQICYGGRISVASSENQVTEPPINDDITVSYSEPDLQTGITTALVVTGPIAEGKDVTSSELFYNPTYGNLVTGMTDYVVSKVIDFDDNGNEIDFYKLMSGRAVPADSNVSLIQISPDLKYNTVSFSTSQQSDGSSKIIMGETMKVPYKIRYIGQNFTKGYEKLSYNAKPFTAAAVEFVFDYTVGFSGSLATVCDKVISSAEVTVNKADKTLTLRCNLRTPGKFYGYIMEYDSAGNLNISFRQPVGRLSGMKIIVDPGHGGNPGAVDYTGKYHEADQTLAISKNLAAYLSSAGAEVYMTRTSDTEVSLEARRLMNQQIKPDLFLSIHLNAAENESRSGTSTYYFTPFSQPLASFINNRLCNVFSSCYKDNPDMLKNVNGGDRYYPFYVTRTDVCPSVLIEVGFITHPLESKYLIDAAYQQAFAKAIYDAICDYAANQ